MNSESLDAYHQSPREAARVASLLAMVPPDTRTILDIGSRDGYITRLLAEQTRQVTALDLRKPEIHHPRIKCVEGNACQLPFPDDHFDLVFCAEVLEHIPEPALTQACAEIARVSRSAVLIGVPFEQDIRVGRTTCNSCQATNPPWGT